MTKEDILHYFQDINFRYNDCMMYDNLSHMLDELISECQQADNADNKERLKDIRGWLIENIFREGYVMYSDAREVNGIDLIEVIASLYNEYHNAVMGEPYDYMFHWANKCGSWVEEDLFDRVLKEDHPDE